MEKSTVDHPLGLLNRLSPPEDSYSSISKNNFSEFDSNSNENGKKCVLRSDLESISGGSVRNCFVKVRCQSLGWICVGLN